MLSSLRKMTREDNRSSRLQMLYFSMYWSLLYLAELLPELCLDFNLLVRQRQVFLMDLSCLL